MGFYEGGVICFGMKALDYLWTNGQLEGLNSCIVIVSRRGRYWVGILGCYWTKFRLHITR